MIANAFSCITSIESLAESGYPIVTNANLSSYIDGTYITPTVISTAYNIPNNSGANTKVGIISLGGGWLPSDLTASLANIGLSLSQPITTVLIDGATNSWTANLASADSENTLDLYCVAGMVPAANIVMYRTLNTTLSFANAIARAVNENCDVISISWGGTEHSDFLGSALASATANGITVCVASGDYGSENTTGTLGVLYPASSPNVVAVGGTQLTYNSSTYQRVSESVSIYSGGGISTVFSVPSWQTGLKANLFFSSNGYSHVSTITGRGVPDISAPFLNYIMWFNGASNNYSISNIALIGGTSASTPIMAGMFARYISASGRRPIPNAIHPILYANTSAYSDIISGNNLSYLTGGFAANVGWDPVVGLGAPIGNVVQQMISSGGTKVKTAANTWSYLANVKVKTAPTTWSNVKAIWTKTISGWSQSF